MKPPTQHHLQIILSIAAKDIRDAIRNKLILGIMIGVALTMLSSQALPLLLKANAQPQAFYMDPARTTLLKELSRDPSVRLIPVDSLEELQKAVGSASVPVLGLVFPDDIGIQLANDTPLEIEAYCIYWASGDDLARLVTYFEEVLSRQTRRVVRLQLVTEPVYPPTEGLGFTAMIATGFILGVMSLGLILAPLLLVEEMENHTLDAILVSPANSTHLLFGKALAGLFYALAAGVVMFAFSWRWIAHWEIAIPAIFLGATSSIAVGLLIGALSKQPSSVNMWSGMAIVLFLVPVFLWTSIAPKLAPGLRLALQAIPSIALSNLMHLSFSRQPAFKEVALLLGGMAIFTAVVLGLVGVRLRRMAR
jgi:hypothetical protein